MPFLFLVRAEEAFKASGRVARFHMGTIATATEAFGHQALEAGFVEKIVGEFFVGEHSKSGALGSGGEFGGFFHGEAGILADDGGDHAHHDLQAADSAGFVLRILSLV